jgi:hypothetical protein
MAMLALLSASCGSLPRAVPPPRLSLRRLPPGAVVVVTKVKRPWYAVKPMVLRTFRKLVPQYQAVAGLERKWFTITQDGRVGGVYVWKERARAEAFFDEGWHRRAVARYGADGEVRMLDVSRALDAPAQPACEGEMVVAIGAGPLERYLGAPGMRLAVEVAGGNEVVSSWQSRAAADHFLARMPVELLAAPVELTR